MTPSPADRSRVLRLVRSVVEVLAPTASTSFVRWWKAPGAWYLTMYPTALIPSLDDTAALQDRAAGQRLFNEVTADDHGPVTLGLYGGDEIHIAWLEGGGSRVWPPPRSGKGLPPLPRRLTTRLDRRERIAVRAIIDKIDTAWLRRRGQPDLKTTRIVIAWIDEIVRAVEDDPECRIVMPFDNETKPCNLWRVSVSVPGVLGLRRDLWWSGRQRLVPESGTRSYRL